jgi:hypothetical protein
MTRTEILDYFKTHGLVEVTFTKVNGETRDMRATRNPDEIPKKFHPKPSAVCKEESEETVRCFDVEAEGWRSFRVDSLIKIEAIEYPIIVD